MKRERILPSHLDEIYDQLVSLLEHAPDHGKIMLSIHIRDGIPQRYETSQESSILLKRNTTV